MLIAQLTDLHVRPRGRPAYRVTETNMLTERAIDAVNAAIGSTLLRSDGNNKPVQ